MGTLAEAWNGAWESDPPCLENYRLLIGAGGGGSIVGVYYELRSHELINLRSAMMSLRASTYGIPVRPMF